jgi:hypothetical protein
LRRLVADKTPHFIDFYRFHLLDDDVHISWIEFLEGSLIYRLNECMTQPIGILTTVSLLPADGRYSTMAVFVKQYIWDTT